MADPKDGTAAGHKEQGLNIINVGDVDAFVERFVRRIRRSEGQQWCRRNLRKYLLREARLARPVGTNEIAAFLRDNGKDELPAWAGYALESGRALHWFAPEVEAWDGDTDFIQALYCVVDWIEAGPG
jgi:hypothetical protein